MWVVRLRDPRVLAAMLLVLAVFAGLALYDVVPTRAYSHEVLFTLPWGTEEGHVGLAAGPDGTFYGPRSFFVSGEQVFVADTFNARIQVFDLTGGLRGSYDLRALEAGVDHPLAVFAATEEESGTHSLGPGDPWINDLAVDRDGQLYLADSAGPRILYLKADGSLLNVVDLETAAGDPEGAGEGETEPDAPVWLLDQLAVGDDGLIYLAHTYLSDQVFSRSLVRIDPAEARFARLASVEMTEGGRLTVDSESPLPIPANSFALGPGGNLYVESGAADPFARSVRRYGEGDRLLRDWLVRHSHRVHSARLIGVDDQGIAHLLLNGGRGDGVVVGMGDGYEGEPIVPVWQAGYAANVYGRSDSTGSLYVAVPGEEGWRLERWQARTGWTFRPAAQRP